MRQESYKILAEHFAEKTGLQVIFEDGACPSTNKETIILPSEINEGCIDPLLGALLHETAHVKFTAEPYSVFKDMGEFARNCTNALEDIRVDHLTMQKYPNSLDFIRELTKRVINTRGAQLKAEPVPVQVLKGLCLKAEGFDVAQIYDNPETLAALAKHEHFIQDARSAQDTFDVADLARRLLIELIGAEGALKDQLQAAADQASQAYQKAKELNAQYKSQGVELSDKADAINKEYKQIRRQQSAARKIERDQYVADQEKNKDLAAALEKKLKEKNNVVKLMTKHYDQEREAYGKAADQRDEIRQEFSKAESDLENADRELTKAAKDLGVTYGKGLSLSGFDALTKEDLAPDLSVKLETKSIDEIIADALLQRKDELVIDEQGSRLNESALADFNTDPEKLFAIKEPRHDLTKVAFVLDVSGSMGYFSEENSKLSLAFDALDVLMRSVKGCIDQGAPCEVSLYAFATECGRVFEGLTNYETEKTKLLMEDARSKMGGGTRLLDAVNQVSSDLLAEAEHRTMILITDADVHPGDCEAIINQTSGDCKQIFISIGAYDLDGAALELFGRNNIMDKKDALEIIGQSLYRAL